MYNSTAVIKQQISNDHEINNPAAQNAHRGILGTSWQDILGPFWWLPTELRIRLDADWSKCRIQNYRINRIHSNPIFAKVDGGKIQIHPIHPQLDLASGPDKPQSSDRKVRCCQKISRTRGLQDRFEAINSGGTQSTGNY